MNIDSMFNQQTVIIYVRVVIFNYAKKLMNLREKYQSKYERNNYHNMK